MSVERLKPKQPTPISVLTNKNKETLSEKPNINTFERTETHHNDSFDLIMSQLNIPDQKAFNQYQAQQWREASIEQKQLALLVCEIDFYKEYLASHGEQGTAFMMLTVALALKNVCALHECFLAYLEQNRLVVLVKGGDEKKLQTIADELCRSVSDTKTEHKSSKTGNIITLSVGYSAVYPGTMSILKDQAHQALENAKHLGGNKTHHHSNKQHHAEIQARIKKRHALIKEKQQQLALKQRISAPEKSTKDLFPELDKNNHTKNKSRTRLYRGQPIIDVKKKSNNEKVDNNIDCDNTKNNIKKTSVTPRMYRGHIIKD